MCTVTLILTGRLAHFADERQHGGRLQEDIEIPRFMHVSDDGLAIDEHDWNVAAGGVLFEKIMNGKWHDEVPVESMCAVVRSDGVMLRGDNRSANQGFADTWVARVPDLREVA
jgi:hypothetical protein